MRFAPAGSQVALGQTHYAAYFMIKWSSLLFKWLHFRSAWNPLMLDWISFEKKKKKRVGIVLFY